MKFILAVAVVAVLMFHVEQSAAQTMDVTAMITSPQSGEIGLDGRTFGYGMAATYVFTGAHENVHIVGTFQYHNHSRAEYMESGLELIKGTDRDLFVAAGLRFSYKALYGQWMLGFTQKRDVLIDKDNDTKPSGYAGWGFQPSRIGLAGGWYFSEFGIQYGLGLNVRF